MEYTSMSDAELVSTITGESEDWCSDFLSAYLTDKTLPESSGYNVSVIDALGELMRRFGVSRRIKVKRPEDIYALTRHFAYGEQERLIVLSLDGSGMVLKITEATVGTSDKTIVHPREVFKNCIRENGTSVIIVHNHPSGSLYPSEQDRDLTKNIIEAGKLLRIKVLDHLIITTDSYRSMREYNDVEW